MLGLYLLYGFAFLALALLVFPQPRRNRPPSFAEDIYLLGWFGLLHGAREWWEAWNVLHGPSSAVASWGRASLLLLSCLCLFEFCRRLVCDSGTATKPRWRVSFGPWVYLPLGTGVCGWIWWCDGSAAGLAVGARYCFGLTGPLAGGGALWGYGRAWGSAITPVTERNLAIAGGSLAAYGIVAGLVVEPDPCLPAWLPTEESFYGWSGMPVEVMRLLAAVVLGGALFRVLREADAAAWRSEEAARAEAIRLNARLSRQVREDSITLEASNRDLRAQIEERRKIEALLREKEKLLETIANNSPAMIRMWGLDRSCTYVNDTWLEFTGMAPDQALGNGWIAAVHPEDVENYRRVGEAGFETRAPFTYEYRLRRLDGVYRWVLEQGKPRYSVSGQFAGFLGSALDITERKDREAQLRTAMAQLQWSERRQREAFHLARQEQGRMRALLSAMNTGVLFEDREHRVEYVNPALLRMWAMEADFEPVGRPIREVAAHTGRRLSNPQGSTGPAVPALCLQETHERLELEFEDGRILAQSSYPVSDPDEHVIGRLWIYEDITHERQTAQQLIYLAERDTLTGLYNRHRLREQLERTIATAVRNGARFSLIYFDLDGFKAVNDSFGHKAGDTVLVRVAGEVGALVRNNELFARLGGDEFAILGSLGHDEDAKALPNRILHAIASVPFRFQGTPTRVTGSIGVAIFPDHGANAEDLVAHADAAMYQAKGMGKNTWALYDPSREETRTTLPQLAWNRQVAEALERDAFELHFQGVYDLAAGGLDHVEALVRIRDPADPSSLIAPARFIPAAEKSGQIVAIDRRILSRAIELLAQNPVLPPLAVNLSGRSFGDPFLPQFIASKLAERRVAPERLMIELVEHNAVSDVQDAQRFVEAVRRTGCRICLKDFGGGFASFSYLNHFGAEFLKVGGRYMTDLPANRDHQVLVKAMVEVACGLGKTLVASCVEDAATLALVRNLGIGLAQGYVLDRPSPEHPALGPKRAAVAAASECRGFVGSI